MLKIINQNRKNKMNRNKKINQNRKKLNKT